MDLSNNPVPQNPNQPQPTSPNTYQNNQPLKPAGGAATIIGIVVFLGVLGFNLFATSSQQKEITDITKLANSIDKNTLSQTSEVTPETETGKIMQAYFKDIETLINDHGKKLDGISEFSLEDATIYKDMLRLELAKKSIQQTADADKFLFDGMKNIMDKYNNKFKDLFSQPAYLTRQADLESITDELEKLVDDTQKLSDLEDVMIKDSLFFLNYVTTNNDKIVVENGEVIIADETVLKQYNDLLDKMVASANEFLTVQESIVNEYSTAFDAVPTY